MTREELAAKVEWEGGVYDTIVDYGLSHIELPYDVPEEIADAWFELEKTERYTRRIEHWLETGEVRSFNV